MGAQQPKQSRHEFLAVLIDTASKKPVPSARIMLGREKVGKLECTIDTFLTGVSNDRGEVRIPNVVPGEYVVFYNLSASVNPGLKGKVVNYGPAPDRGYIYRAQLDMAVDSLGGRAVATKGSELGVVDGHFVVVKGYIYRPELDIVMIIRDKGEPLKVRVPNAGGAPVGIEISTDILLSRAHKSGQ